MAIRKHTENRPDEKKSGEVPGIEKESKAAIDSKKQTKKLIKTSKNR